MKSLYFRIKNYFAILALTVWVCLPISEADACCVAPTQTLIEMLNTQDTSLHIFTGKVTKTIKVDGFASLMVVTKRIKGHPKDTILLHTGGFSSAGGKYLEAGSEHLIVSKVRGELAYGAYVCDWFSAPLSINKLAQYVNEYDFIGMHRLRNIVQYYRYKSQKHTGEVKFMMDDKIVAKGALEKGELTGEWRYYMSNRDGDVYPFSIANYDKGKLSGLYTRFGWESKNKTYEAYYKDDKVFSAKTWAGRSNYLKRSLKKRIDKDQTITEGVQYDDKGKVIYESTHIYKTLPNHISVRYQHGYGSSFDKKTGLVSNGEFYFGAKVGKWNLYNESGDLVESIDYAYPEKDEIYDLVIYNESGALKQAVRVNFQGYQIVLEEYDRDGSQCSTRTVSNDGLVTLRRVSKYGSSESFYRNNKMEGRQVYYRPDSTLSSEKYYTSGLQQGLAREYHTNGNLKSEKRYENGAIVGEEHFYNEAGELLQTNYRDRYGCLQGPCKHYVEGKLRSVGKYLDGFKVGEWKEYNLYGQDKYSYSVKQYSELLEGQYSRREEQLISTEFFDNEGNKIIR